MLEYGLLMNQYRSYVHNNIGTRVERGEIIKRK